MAMPAQLKRGLQARRRRPRQRQLIDELPYIDIRTWGRRKMFPGDWFKTNVFPDIGLVHPGLRSLATTRAAITVTFDTGGHQQTIPLTWYTPHLGGYRPVGQCRCKRTAFRFYRMRGALICKQCARRAGAVYASQTRDADTRPRLQASRLRIFIGGPPNITGRFPSKPANMRWRTFNRLKERCLALEARPQRPSKQKHIDRAILRPRQRYRTWATAAVANSG
jgi:hypothetical protein